MSEPTKDVDEDLVDFAKAQTDKLRQRQQAVAQAERLGLWRGSFDLRWERRNMEKGRGR